MDDRDPIRSERGCGSTEAGQLKELLALHEAALECMAHGLCMVDAAQRLTLYNRRFIEIFNLVPEAVQRRHADRRRDAPLGHAREFSARAARRGDAAPARADGARRAVPARAPHAGRARVQHELSPARQWRLDHAGRGRDRVQAPGARPARPVRAVRAGPQPHVARPVRDRFRAPHRAVQPPVPRDVRPVGGRHPGRRLDARRGRLPWRRADTSPRRPPSGCGSGGWRRWRRASRSSSTRT